MKNGFILMAVLVTFPFNVVASQLDAGSVTPLTTPPVSMASIFQVIVALLVILFIIITISWLYKRVGYKYSISGESIKVLSAISLGGKENAVLLQVGNEQVVLGVSPGNVRKVHTLAEPVEIIKNTSQENFITKLNREINKVVSK